MIGVSSQVKVFAALAPTDMRKSFCGLTGIIEKEFGQQIENGDLFLFFNRRRNLLKVLYFTGDGTMILYKRLEAGTFEMLRQPSEASFPRSERQEASATTALPYMVIRADELVWLLDGIELSSIKRRKWWRRDRANPSAKNAAASS
jgi:transposase